MECSLRDLRKSSGRMLSLASAAARRSASSSMLARVRAEVLDQLLAAAVELLVVGSTSAWE